MGWSYTQDELLKLRNSPLVCKPANLPSAEEWMGPVPDHAQIQSQNHRRTANRGRNEEALMNDSTSNQRPLYESKARSTNVPEDIILGPPKTAFASASGTRNSPKTFDSPHRSSFINNDESTSRNERRNFRERQTKGAQRDGEQSRDSKGGPHLNRRSVKDDSNLWSGARQHKSSALDDGERPYRRNGDRGLEKDGQAGRDNRASRGFENHRIEGDRDKDSENKTRRQGVGRGRHEPSWYRDDSRKGESGLENEEVSKAQGWQEKDGEFPRRPDRDWGKGTKADLDPEWMETPETDNSSQIHTQEDFERWKERMKSGKATKSETKVEQRGVHDRGGSGVGVSVAKGKVDTPLVVDSSVDGFFGLWNQSKNQATTEMQLNGNQPNLSNAGSKVSKSSKFTGFFNPKPDLDPDPSKEESSSPSAVPGTDSSSEDKEGFQRILNLLGQQQQSQTGKAETPPRTQQPRGNVASLPAQPLKNLENNELYNLFGAKSPPANAAPQGKDSEFLLKLMQQPQPQRLDLNQSNLSGRRVDQDTPSRLLPLSNLMISPQDTPQQTPSSQPPPGFLDDMSTRDKLNPGTDLRRGPPPGFMDSSASHQSAAGVPQQPGFPVGLQRPPGLDQVPPGYAQNVGSQRQAMIPPPGFQAQTRSQNTFPPGLTPNDRVQFAMPTAGRGVPPAGFMHPAPQSFPVPFGQEGMPFGGFSDAGNFGHAFPPGQQRR